METRWNEGDKCVEGFTIRELRQTQGLLIYVQVYKGLSMRYIIDDMRRIRLLKNFLVCNRINLAGILSKV